MTNLRKKESTIDSFNVISTYELQVLKSKKSTPQDPDKMPLICLNVIFIWML